MKVMEKNGMEHWCISLCFPEVCSCEPRDQIWGMWPLLVDPTPTLSVSPCFLYLCWSDLKVTRWGCADTKEILLEKIPRSLLEKKLLQKNSFFSYFAWRNTFSLNHWDSGICLFTQTGFTIETNIRPQLQFLLLNICRYFLSVWQQKLKF